MSARYVVLIIFAAIMVASFVALIFSDHVIRAISFYSLLGSGVVVLISFILVVWAGMERLRTDSQVAHSQLHRELAVYQASNVILERELNEMRRLIFGHILSCGSDVQRDFDTALVELLQKDSDRDG